MGEKRIFLQFISSFSHTVECVTLCCIASIICSLPYAKMGSIKDRNGMNLTEAEDIKRRWQEYTEELYKK